MCCVDVSGIYPSTQCIWAPPLMKVIQYSASNVATQWKHVILFNFCHTCFFTLIAYFGHPLYRTDTLLPEALQLFLSIHFMVWKRRKEGDDGGIREEVEGEGEREGKMCVLMLTRSVWVWLACPLIGTHLQSGTGRCGSDPGCTESVPSSLLSSLSSSCGVRSPSAATKWPSLCWPCSSTSGMMWATTLLWRWALYSCITLFLTCITLYSWLV